MKKLILTMMSFILLNLLYAQTPCTPTNNLNISTGQNGSGGLIASGTSDPFWTTSTVGATNIAVTPGIPGNTAWNNITGSLVLNYKQGNTGVATFKRCFYVCQKTIINFSGNFKCDNKVISLKLISCNNPQQVFWTYTVPSSLGDPQCWTNIPFNGSANLSVAGNYAIEFTYNNSGSYGGLALQGNITASTSILANKDNCCTLPPLSCCDSIDFKKIMGPNQVKCMEKATFSVTPCKDVSSYTWSILPTTTFIGQGTNSITLTPPIAPGNYTITLKMLCNNKVFTKNYTITVVGPTTCDPSFTFSYNQLPNGNVNVTTTPAASTQIAGTEHWWGIQHNGTFPNCTNPCAAIPFTNFTSTGVWGGYINTAGMLTPYMGTGITKGPSGYGMSYDGVGLGSCIKITHYIKCCGVLYRQTQCVSFSIPTNAKVAGGAKPVAQTEVGKVEMVNNNSKE